MELLVDRPRHAIAYEHLRKIHQDTSLTPALLVGLLQVLMDRRCHLLATAGDT